MKTKVAKLEDEKLLLADKLTQNSKPRYTKREIFELLKTFLSSPWNVWEKGNLTLRKNVLRLTFESPLAYDRENGFRTPQVSVIFEFLADFTLKCKMVRSRRLELPLRLRNSDLNAARLPIPPRPHCLRLGVGAYRPASKCCEAENHLFSAECFLLPAATADAVNPTAIPAMSGSAKHGASSRGTVPALPAKLPGKPAFLNCLLNKQIHQFRSRQSSKEFALSAKPSGLWGSMFRIRSGGH